MVGALTLLLNKEPEFLIYIRKNILVHNKCLKWEMEMMTSRFRITVKKETAESRTYISITAVWGCAGFLQEEFSCGTQSSISSIAFIVRKKSLVISGRHSCFIPCINDPSSHSKCVSLWFLYSLVNKKTDFWFWSHQTFLFSNHRKHMCSTLTCNFFLFSSD